jgi:hypothetical protein
LSAHLDELLRLEAEDVDLDLVQDRALLGVLRGLVALAVELEELRNVLLHVVVARRLRHVLAEDVDALEIELRGVDADVAIRVVHRDVAEAERRLFPVLRLEVGTRAGVLDLDELLLPLRVARGGLM